MSGQLRTETERSSEASSPTELINNVSVRPHPVTLRQVVIDANRFLPLSETPTKSQTRGMGRLKRTPADVALMRTMGARLRWVREAYGKTQEQMAAAVGIDQTTWSYYELGKRWPDQFAAPRLIAKLKISREYLLDGSLEGVERLLAIRLAASHPELASPMSKAPRKSRLRA